MNVEYGMRKRSIGILLALVLMVSFSSVSYAAELKSFDDVDNSSWYAPYVYALYQKGVVSGMTSSAFAPQQSLTRAQLVTMLAYYETKETLETYRSANKFSDVKADGWYAPFVNWAATVGFVAGYKEGSFLPNRPVTRAEAATMIIRYAELTDGIGIEKTKDPVEFKDEIPQWAETYISDAQQAGFFSGYPDGKFLPDKTMTRGEVSAVLCRLYRIEPLAKDQLPKQQTAPIESIQRSVAGVYVNGVQFDPSKGYRASIVLANNRFYSTESASSMVKRTGAVVASNGAFFNNQGDLTTYSAFVRDGKALRIDNANYPHKCYFVVDSNGKASMQFMKILQTVTLFRDGEEVPGAFLEEVGCNYKFDQNDGSRMIFTKEFGSQVPGTVKVAVLCDGNGKVTKVIRSSSGQTVSIPENGFVLCVRHRRDETSSYKWEKFYDEVKVGDTVKRTMSYENSSVQDIQMAFCCGPTVVKNGKAYGNTSTYQQEGYTEGRIISGSSERTCIGVKADGTVVIITATTSMSGLSNIMVQLGCQTAMNLDGGASSALYVNGSARVAPGRALTHMLVFTKA